MGSVISLSLYKLFLSSVKLDESSKEVTEFLWFSQGWHTGEEVMRLFLLIIACSAFRDFHRSHKISFDHNVLHKSSQDGQDGLTGFALKLCSF